MSIAPARRAALKVLGRVREREAYGPETLDAVLGTARLNASDHALATRLTYGTLQTSGVLDEALDRFISRPGDVEPRVRDALRLAAYELLFARTPPRAVVHQGVEAVRSARPQAAGMANAVLRRLAEAAADFPWGDPETDLSALARATGHPLWIAELFVRDLGRETAESVLRADLEPGPLYLFHNPFLGTFDDAFAALEAEGADPVACEPPGCIEARVPAAAVRGEVVASGACLVADAAAQIAARVVGAHPRGLIVDLTAGRGTKTVQMQAISLAAGAPAKIIAAVLVDAPCSGLGTLRRRAEKRWRLREADLEPLSALQGGLLRAASSLVRRGGVVVYSTCSLARRENHDVLEGFLATDEGRGFAVKDIVEAVPATMRDLIGPEGYFQSTPQVGGPDGHFVAALTREG
jgi:16S rRNA (cytosine967-C5)-methyltransferase